MRAPGWLSAVLILSGALACGRTEVVHFVVFPPDASVPVGDAGAPDAGPADAGPPDAGPLDAGCEPRSLPLEPAVPTVMFLFDRSGSMTDDLDGNADGGPSRWSVLTRSMRQVLPPRDQQLAMGALFYPTAGLDSCNVPGAVDLSPALGNANALLALFATPPKGGTPTSAAVDLAATHLACLRAANTARALVVTTDGAPNCNGALNPFTCTCTLATVTPTGCANAEGCLDDVRTVQQLSDLVRTAHLPTYVVGLGSQLNQYANTLDQMAVAGGAPRVGTGHRYYAADSEPELTDAFTRITSQLARCTYLTNTTLGPHDAFEVLVGGDVITPGPNGWEWTDQANGELTLRGAACDRAAAGVVASALIECQ